MWAEGSPMPAPGDGYSGERASALDSLETPLLGTRAAARRVLSRGVGSAVDGDGAFVDV